MGVRAGEPNGDRPSGTILLVGESGAPELRIGDTERDDALRALGDHLAGGRLDAEEYGDRAARVTAARTRGELTALFTDLPQPHPRLVEKLPASKPAANRPARPTGQQISAALVPLSALLALVLFFAADLSWVVFLLPAAVAIVTGAIWGKR